MADNTYQRNYRSSNPGGRDPGSEASDPLTELARLIGQSDPFAADPRAVAPRGSRTDEAAWRQANHDRRAEPSPRYADDADYRPAEESRHAAGQYEYGRQPEYDRQNEHGYEQDHDHSQLQPEQAYDRHGQPLQHGWDEQQPAAFGEPGYDRFAGDDGRTAAPRYRDDYDHGYEADDQDAERHVRRQPSARRSGLMMTAAAVVAVALVGSAGAVAYRTFFKSAPGAPPVIRAADAPNKIVPTGQASDGGKAYADRVGPGGQNEKLVSRQEEPVDLTRAIAAAPPPVSVPPMAFAPSAQASPATPGSNPATEPRKIRTVPIHADQGLPPRSSPPATRLSAPQPLTSGTAPSSSGPLSLSPQTEPSEPARQPTRTASIPPRPAPEAQAAASGYYVQLSAQKSEAEAQAAFRSAQAKYASLLGGQKLVIRRKDVGSKVFYGAQVGPLGKDQAARLCGDLKTAGGSCLIQRN